MKQYISWFFFSLIIGVIVACSSVSQPVFKDHYSAFLDALPITKETHRYLLTHYKFGHPICYAFLSLVACLCFKNRYLLTILIIFSLGVLLEGVQYFLPTRSASFWDIGYNMAGVFTGLVFFLLCQTIQKKSRAQELAKENNPTPQSENL